MMILCVLETTVLKTLLMNGTTLINGRNLDNILKSKDITLLTKVCTVKGLVFSVVTCESWTIKKTECQRIDAFKLWCWRDSLENPGQQRDQTSQS